MSRSLPATPSPPSAPREDPLADYRRRFDAELAAWLAGRRAAPVTAVRGAGDLDATLAELVLRGGKRLRPALVHFAHRGCGGGEPERVRALALATELLHTYLLIHDDLMDRAETRRGRPTAHALHRDRHAAGGHGDAAHFGASVALLAGDLGCAYAVELAAAAIPGGAAGEAARGVFAAMCREVIVGQYLEFTVPYREAPSADELLEILRLKSGRYSAERPIQLGALLAGAPPGRCEALGRYGRAVGEAFQLQDDLLGTFGRPEATGKPVGADLREGKLTLLVHCALARAGAGERASILAALGDRDLTPPAAAAVQELVEATGARAAIERMVEERLGEAAASLGQVELTPDAMRFFSSLLAHLRERDQ